MEQKNVNGAETRSKNVWITWKNEKKKKVNYMGKCIKKKELQEKKGAKNVNYMDKWNYSMNI